MLRTIRSAVPRLRITAGSSASCPVATAPKSNEIGETDSALPTPTPASGTTASPPALGILSAPLPAPAPDGAYRTRTVRLAPGASVALVAGGETRVKSAEVPAPRAMLSRLTGAPPTLPTVISSVAAAPTATSPKSRLGGSRARGCGVSGVLSMLTVTVADARWPALSTAMPVNDRLATSVVTSIGGGHEATPEVVSLHSKRMVTLVSFQPSAPGGGEIEPTMVGGVLSMLSVAVAVAPLPARSVAAPLTFWSPPSVVAVTGGGQATTPESASLQAKLTVTSPEFQPLALAAGNREAISEGDVLSTLSVTLAVAVLPAWSLAVPVMTCSAPSVSTQRAPGHEAIPLPASEQTKTTVTPASYHPAGLGDRSTDAWMVGAMPSWNTPTVTGGLARPWPPDPTA